MNLDGDTHSERNPGFDREKTPWRDQLRGRRHLRIAYYFIGTAHIVGGLYVKSIFIFMSLLVEHTMSLKFVNYTKKKIKNNKIKPNSPERLTLLLTYTVPCCLFQTNEKFLTQRKYSHQKDYLASEFQKQRHITNCVKHCFNKHVFKNDDNYFVATTTLKLLLPHTKNANPKLFWVLQITRKMSIT